MARDFDSFPTYDPVIKKDDVYLSSIWSDFMATFVHTLQGYLSQNGMFVPVLTLAQQAQIQKPQIGQMVFVSDAGQLQIWQIVGGAGQWTIIV